MAVRIVQLGSRRSSGEGTRLGTVRRPPRGVRKSRYARDDWFDVWLPMLAPSAALMRKSRIREDGTGWAAFARRYTSELKRPDQSRLLDALAALSHHANFSIGCYCDDETRCHRSILRQALRDRRAAIG